MVVLLHNMKKPIEEMIWPVTNYTDKIHFAVKCKMKEYSHLSFTISQLLPNIQRGYPWLNNPDERQLTLLKQIVKTGLTKLVQLGLVKRVTSNVSVEPQWQAASTVAESGYTNITSEDDVVATPAHRKPLAAGPSVAEHCGASTRKRLISNTR